MEEEDIHLDHQLMQRISRSDNLAYDTLFRKYYVYLCGVVYRMTQDKHQAEDAVQEVFLEIWRKRETIEIKNAVKSYLHRASVNKTLNRIRASKVKYEEEEKLKSIPSEKASPLQLMQGAELQNVIDKAYKSLPERCRIVFTMVKYEGMSYKKTAEKLEISVKTVENQVSKALRIMRSVISKYKSESE